jgi:hypothetical protein
MVVPPTTTCSFVVHELENPRWVAIKWWLLDYHASISVRIVVRMLNSTESFHRVKQKTTYEVWQDKTFGQGLKTEENTGPLCPGTTWPHQTLKWMIFHPKSCTYCALVLFHPKKRTELSSAPTPLLQQYEEKFKLREVQVRRWIVVGNTQDPYIKPCILNNNNII